MADNQRNINAQNNFWNIYWQAKARCDAAVARATTWEERRVAYDVFEHAQRVATLVCIHGMTHEQATRKVGPPPR